jgi:hypothetical protein
VATAHRDCACFVACFEKGAPTIKFIQVEQKIDLDLPLVAGELAQATGRASGAREEGESAFMGHLQ